LGPFTSWNANSRVPTMTITAVSTVVVCVVVCEVKATGDSVIVCVLVTASAVIVRVTEVRGVFRV
jgi:hypothetical protein